MSILAIIALTVLVMVAGGYYVGRLRAVRAVSGETVRLHSLPNYHGYYVAIWTGLPAFLLILAFSVFGAGVIERLTFEELRREAAPLTQQLDAALASDAVYQDEQARIAALQGRARAVSAEMSDLRSARGEARDPDRLAALRAEQIDVLNLARTAEEAAMARHRELVTGIEAEARSDGTERNDSRRHE